MDEFEFQRVLNLFPIARPRDYHADSVSSRQLTAQPTQSERKEWRDAWDATDGKEIEIEGNESDAFWRKLKMTAEKKVGSAKAERFCNAFQKVHNKLVNEELSLEAASKFLRS
ncbi:RRNA-processing protein [Actinidia chinensis var. chinensis]|uniref:rRNA-processing protein n=1 Tax=Actinidia chinensis var. chinensis TaxID=1590841 RepID=A0A2R6PFF9_ACTCC|nr:RRNA-processing protein [Actinidia chinensis var. chinensis]